MKKLPSKGLDFVHAQQAQKAVRSGTNGKKALLVLLPVLLLAGGLGTFGLLTWQQVVYTARSESLVQAVGAMDKDGRYQQALEAEAQAAALQKQVNNARRVRDAIDSYPQLSTELFEIIRSAAPDGAQIDELVYAAGRLSLAGEVPHIGDAAVYVARLRASGACLAIDYTGYTQRADADGPETYRFQITAFLKGEEGTSDGQ